MNTLMDPVMALPDVQSSPDTRQIPIQRVGVRDVRHPMLLEAGQAGVIPTVAQWEMTVALSAATKGTHMSRFVALLEQYRRTPMRPALFCQMAQGMLDLLQADAGDVSASFPFFINKAAPVSGVQSLMDYQVRWRAHVRRGEPAQFNLYVQVPVTSLCPCSKAISEYGAHNQRSHISAELTYAPAAQVDMEGVIQHIEEQASCELWGLLKRADEKFVTERAYENPKFVEDLVRDVAGYLYRVPGVTRFRVEAENFESIHNHSAYAVVESQ
ncbi:GTP cyclohydrolase FolE2 [Alcaligenaceae bacterium CGII-47]|nr:GTP cyclohydrolase FolE2 [Alcaligenaceae bacterium CGII-47]